MFITNHTLAGTLLGIALRGRPVTAFAVGVASHLIMDAMPHWGAGEGDTWMQVAPRDGLVGLAALGAVTLAVPREDRIGVLAGAAGAITPDLRAPVGVAFDVQPLPDALDKVHSEVQEGREAPRRLRLELGAAVLLATAVTAGLRRLRASRSRASGHAAAAPMNPIG